MKLFKYPERKDWKKILARPVLNIRSLETTVANILNDVKANGDDSLRKFSLMFDKVALNELQVSAREIEEAAALVGDELKEAITLAKKNIHAFHIAQLTSDEVVEIMPGITCWRKSVPIEKVGLYIPGGTAPLFSTLLMLAIPAVIAGCKEIILCSPPDTSGNLHPAMLYAAQLTGINKVFRVGGVQAIAAMAYGTETIDQVYKILGPGNQYVMCAKQLVQKDGLSIDMPAGPSEVAVFADDTANPAFVAADLLSQAEHGIDSQVLLVTCDEAFWPRVEEEVAKQLAWLPRKNIAGKVWASSAVVVVHDENEAIDLLNEYAAEHLILSCRNAKEMADRVINAGSVFLGNFSPESAGDYASGTNHTLPTNGYAHSYSGVSVDSFVKKITFQRLSAEGLRGISSAVQLMAEAEGLQAHANAVRIRQDQYGEGSQ